MPMICIFEEHSFTLNKANAQCFPQGKHANVFLVPCLCLCSFTKVFFFYKSFLYIRNHQLVPGLFETSHLLLVVNCSLNFPIYFLAGGGCQRRREARELGTVPELELDTRANNGPCPCQGPQCVLHPESTLFILVV